MIYVFLWGIIGILTYGWLSRPITNWTYGELIQVLFMGMIAGPIFFFCVVFMIIVNAEFWNKPIFKKK